MMVKVYKKNKNKGEENFHNSLINSEFVYSLEVSDVETALELLKINNNGEMAKINVSDGDFLVDEDGVPHMITENCTRLKKLGGKVCEIHRYGESI